MEASPGPSRDLSIAQKVCLQHNNNIIRQVSKFLHVLNIVQELKFNSIFLLKVQHENNNITRTSLNYIQHYIRMRILFPFITYNYMRGELCRILETISVKGDK